MFNFVAQRPSKQGTKYGLNLGQNVKLSFLSIFKTLHCSSILLNPSSCADH